MTKDIPVTCPKCKTIFSLAALVSKADKHHVHNIRCIKCGASIGRTMSPGLSGKW